MQTFETDFWKDAQLRKVWDQIVPGEPRKTILYTSTLEAIQKYCRVVGDLHPLYFDEEYAGKSPYEGLIAPPAIHILLMFACTPADDWMYPLGGIHRRLETRWKAAIKPGDTITPSAVVTSKKQTAQSRWLSLDILVRNQRGEILAQAEAMVEFPTALYTRSQEPPLKNGLAQLRSLTRVVTFLLAA